MCAACGGSDNNPNNPTPNPNTQPIVFRVNMEAGHGGKSGRFQRYKEYAEGYAFVLDQLGVKQ